MDPDANLAEQATLLNAETGHDKRRRRELRVALREWLGKQGFEPNWKKHPEAAKAFKKWMRDSAKFDF